MPEGPFISPIDADGVNVMGPMLQVPDTDATEGSDPPVISSAQHSTVAINVAIGI